LSIFIALYLHNLRDNLRSLCGLAAG